MTPQENWRPVVGYEGLYEVSDLGRVRSLDRTTAFRGSERRVRGRILRTWLARGYEYVTLCRDGEQRRKRMHVLVAEAFHGPRPDGMTDVRHLDGDQRNNVPANLAYGTRSDNMRDAVAHGTNPYAAKTHCKHGHEFTPDNTIVRIQKKNGRPSRGCLTCHREAARRQHQREREAKQSA